MSDPLVNRYASREMVDLFTEQHKIRTWRRLWIALAESLREVGFPITQGQIDEMKAAVEKIDFAKAGELEERFRHDVMAHIHAFGIECPAARPIIHLGATSAFVTDNTDLVLFRDGLGLLIGRTAALLRILRERAMEYRCLPVLGYTHFQPAQLTTLGKRVCLWAQDILTDLKDLLRVRDELLFRSAKGTTGTQASYLALLGDAPEKVRELERLLARRMGFSGVYPVTGQTYPRKLDYRIFAVLSGIAQSSSKFASDVRLLSHTGELEEPFEKDQIGSSAMAYKRNPMRCERMNALSRYLITLAMNPAMTAATQWLERSLDDSANRRLVIPRGFMLADALMILYCNVASGFKVNEAVVNARVRNEIPFQISEGIIMRVVARGGDRQEVHERLRRLSLEARGQAMEGLDTRQLLKSIASDPLFGMTEDQLDEMANPVKLAGMAPLQVEEFIKNELDPILSSLPEGSPAPEAPKV